MNETETLRERVVELNRQLEQLSYNKPLQAWIDYQAGDSKSALEYWEKAAQRDDDKGLQARRCLAVFHHSQAYDLEIAGRKSESAQYWRAGLKHWAEVFQSKTFRNLLPGLSAVQSGQALDYAELDAMIEILSESVLSPNETLANRAAESKDWKSAAQHIELIRQSGFAEPVYSAVLDRILKKACDIFYGEIEHTTFDEQSARSLEERSNFAKEHFPGRINGRLNLLAGAIWRGKKASETLNDIDPAWARIRELKTQNKLSEIASWRWGEREQDVAFLAKNRLQEVAEAACELEMARMSSLMLRRLKVNERLNEAVRLSSIPMARGAVDEYFGIVGQLQHADRDAARRLCEELCQQYGGELKLSALKDTLQKVRERIAEESQDLRTLRSQLRG